MTHRLHNPASQAHIEELKDRLSCVLSDAPLGPCDPGRGTALVGALADVVRAMDRGAISAGMARELFAGFPIPGFSFEAWLEEMTEEGVYLDGVLAEAA